jgi:hypothetical protein
MTSKRRGFFGTSCLRMTKKKTLRMTNMGGMTKRWYDRKGGYDKKGAE